ncbi:hypothetical protein Ancab_021109 [Ancistrocladus abbreviatus]
MQQDSTSIHSSVSDFVSQVPYSSIFFRSELPDHFTSNTTTTPTHPTATTSQIATPPATTSPTATTTSNARFCLLMLEHQDLLNRHTRCLSNLQKTFQEAETLRQENTNLRIANRDLSNQLNLLIQATFQNNLPAASLSPSEYDNALSSLAGSIGGLQIGEMRRREGGGRDDAETSPTSVMENDQVERLDVQRVSLPKSISVRSNGFLKITQAGPSCGNGDYQDRRANRIQSLSTIKGPQKVYVRGGSKKDGPIELEVYNQGMSKTELCNKWQESGTCPYGIHCQFAHGLGELRPVIRHPRYKTEVCRMVLAGDTCPYGHRCHFRHALTEQEKFMGPLKLD